MTPSSGLPTTAQSPFSQRVRELSVRVHEDLERSTFLTALTTGRLDLTAYAALAGQHVAIYRQLEHLGDGFADDPIAGLFLFPELRRGPELARDLAHLQSLGVPIAAPTAVTTRYVERLAELATWPGGFVAHHYVRYLGDLSGGQLIGRAISREYGLGEDGLRFYTFPGIPKPKRFKDAYRALLDTVGFDPVEQEHVLEEIRLAYRFNFEIFGSLEGAFGAT